MPGTIFIDFETFSHCNLKMQGAMRYAKDPTTEIICLAYSINGKSPRLWTLGDDLPKKLFKAIKKGYQVHAWNVFFEIVIYHHICVNQYKWPAIRFNQWRDTQATAAMYALPLSLDECGSVLDLDIVKDKRGKYLINKLCKRRRPSKANPETRWTTVTAPDDFEDMYEYCRQDVRAEQAIDKALPSRLTPRELHVWRLTLRKNLRGVPVDLQLVNSIVDKMDIMQDELHEEITKLTDGVITTGGQLARMKGWMAEQHGYTIEGMTADIVADALAGDLSKPVRRLLQLRQLLSKSSTKKFIKIQKAAVTMDGGKTWTIHGCLRYHKATTGRWGGALLQPQNMPRASVSDPELAIKAFIHLSFDDLSILYSNVPYTASALVRPAICAPKGYILFDSDFSSVENCTIMWLADAKEGLKLLFKGKDLYIDMASSLHPEYTYSWIKEHKGISSEADHLRRHGKLTILGAVYSMGWKKFIMTCEKMGFDITPDEAKFTISTFREKYNEIVQLWYGLERCAKKAMGTPGVKFRYIHIQFVVEKGFLFMILPNGKRLAYYNPAIEVKQTPWGARKPCITHEGYLGTTHKWGRPVLTPGRLAENASQAVARELLVDGMFNLEDAGFPIILSVHDEALSLVKKEENRTLEEYNKLLCDVSKVFRTIPLSASGFIAKRFRK